MKSELPGRYDLWNRAAALVILAITLTACVETRPPEPLYLRLTDGDVALADRTVQEALETSPSGTPMDWHNVVSGNSGAITPLRTYKAGGGYYCREYRETLDVGGANETYTDAACRDVDGQWKHIRS